EPLPELVPLRRPAARPTGPLVRAGEVLVPLRGDFVVPLGGALGAPGAGGLGRPLPGNQARVPGRKRGPVLTHLPNDADRVAYVVLGTAHEHLDDLVAETLL